MKPGKVLTVSMGVLLILISMTVIWPETYTKNYQEGWYLMSFPCETTTSDPAELFSSGYREVYGIEAGEMKHYSDLTSAGTGLGYWVHYGSATQTEITCSPVTSPTYETTLNSGWNMIGSPYGSSRWSESTIDGESVSTSSRIASSLYGYNSETGMYEETNIMLSWNGYFLKADSGGTLSFSTMTANTPPVADAGDDKSCIGGKYYEDAGTTNGGDGLIGVFTQHDIPCELDGSGSNDSDGDVLVFSWKQTGGPNVDLVSSSASVTTFIPGENATYTFQLEVGDGISTAYDTVIVSARKLTGKLVYSSLNIESTDVYIMDLEDTSGDGLTRITDHSGMESVPQWASDGAMIVFDSDRGGDWDIYTINSDGTGIVNISNSTSTDRYPDWSINGRIVFVSDRNGSQEVFDMNSEGNDVRQITSIGKNSLSPEYSPNGNLIAFNTDYGGDVYEIYSMSEDGSSLNRLTNDSYVQGYPSWTPDGRILYMEQDDYGSPFRFKVMNSDGSNIQDWPYPDSVTYIVANEMSSDGQFIFYSSDDQRLHVMLSDGSIDVDLGVYGRRPDHYPGP